ncbi:hypothetical protein GRI42_06665 [Erythrobacter gaetbuli]|uniref:Uncharacterized protein n=1 Tax=Qipengyuania gaetbuli TaxID=266952 RepID=A0A844Y0V3_9SPHN|nr:hypothetical protein [Qipengyuania gaetbuli]MXO50983.1 hypothetical protein [Qipengyuania gaetbuli]
MGGSVSAQSSEPVADASSGWRVADHLAFVSFENANVFLGKGAEKATSPVAEVSTWIESRTTTTLRWSVVLNPGIPARTSKAAAPQSWRPIRNSPVLEAASPSNFPLRQAHPIDRSERDYSKAIATYGPFRVIDRFRVALVGETDTTTPALFQVMMRRHPQLTQIDMVECPGTRDDTANLKLGRLIRAHGLMTFVPRRGSVRSGAVDLFLSGVVKEIADGAEFAVHSWLDETGREPNDYAADAPENRRYLTYYREMGMADAQARAFYAFTNSVPHRSAKWIGAGDMRRWIGGAPTPSKPTYLARN